MYLLTYVNRAFMIRHSSRKSAASLAAALCASVAAAACAPDPSSGAGPQATVSSTSTDLSSAPTVPLYHPEDPQLQHEYLQCGNNNDAYWMVDSAWGAGNMTEGTAPDQYEQNVGVYPPVGTSGEVAFRIKWRWPAYSGDIRTYPAVLSGRKPGYYSSGNLVDGEVVRLLDGSISQRAPTGDTPGTFMPLQLPVPPIMAQFARSDVAPPSGRGQLTFDIWLQSAPGQDVGFSNSSITHEIMIPLGNWGGYGSYPNNRNPGWYDHDAVIDGRLYHVYCTKDSDSQLRYDFGWLNGHYGRSGWKMIAFVPDVTPVPPGQLNLASFINYLSTRRDVAGTPWAQGNEYLASVELGPEIAEGSGDIVIYDYEVSLAPQRQPMRIQAENTAISGTGVAARTDFPGYEGTGFVGPFSDAGDRITATFPNVVAGTYDVRIRYASGGLQLNDVIVNNTTWSQSFAGTNNTWGIATISAVTLPAGTTTLSIVKEWGWIYVDYLELMPSSTSPGGSSTATHIQAEDGTLTGALKIETYAPGSEGVGAVGPFSNDGDRVTVNFPNVAAGPYDVRIRYRSGATQVNNVTINGTTWNKPFPGTNNTWAITTITGVGLRAGTNTVSVSKDWGWIDVDYIEIVSSSFASTATRIEAEEGTLTNVGVEATFAGYTGSGAVSPFANPGDRVTVSFKNVIARKYDVRVRFHSNNNPPYPNDVIVNGTTYTMPFGSTGSSWGFVIVSGVMLNAGTNTVVIATNWGWIAVDYIEIVPSGP
jgi:hypothetical protein